MYGALVLTAFASGTSVGSMVAAADGDGWAVVTLNTDPGQWLEEVAVRELTKALLDEIGDSPCTVTVSAGAGETVFDRWADLVRWGQLGFLPSRRAVYRITDQGPAIDLHRGRSGPRHTHATPGSAGCQPAR